MVHIRPALDQTEAKKGAKVLPKTAATLAVGKRRLKQTTGRLLDLIYRTGKHHQKGKYCVEMLLA